MPYGYERLNERSQRPNALINFIKPLEGSDKTVAEDFLNRIAAQCYPIMKAAHVSVMSLEEFPANREFLGRNFNAGECIQLVLKDKQGRWLGFNFVQMVMMHELAHCKQMNHSKYFWKVRNEYSAEMRQLWQRKYQGEGLWGRGQNLASGGFVLEREVNQDDIPEHLCGGSYRRRGRKRKRGSEREGEALSYAERQQRRIAKKFGKHGDGNELGEDEMIRGALEQGKRRSGKPRVANSKRGRELRLQAALARFDAAKQQQESAPAEKDEGSETESEDDWTDDDASTLTARHSGKDYIKVCDKEDEDEKDFNQEMGELYAFGDKSSSGDTIISAASSERLPAKAPVAPRSSSQTRTEPTKDEEQHLAESLSASHDVSNEELSPIEINKVPPATSSAPNKGFTSCPICSLDNDPGSLLCTACSHVLRPSMVRGNWRCKSESCQSNEYLNAGDVGRCGLCGAGKPTQAPLPAPGPIGADVLRWE